MPDLRFSLRRVSALPIQPPRWFCMKSRSGIICVKNTSEHSLSNCCTQRKPTLRSHFETQVPAVTCLQDTWIGCVLIFLLVIKVTFLSIKWCKLWLTALYSSSMTHSALLSMYPAIGTTVINRVPAYQVFWLLFSLFLLLLCPPYYGKPRKTRIELCQYRLPIHSKKSVSVILDQHESLYVIFVTWICFHLLQWNLKRKETIISNSIWSLWRHEEWH